MAGPNITLDMAKAVLDGRYQAAGTGESPGRRPCGAVRSQGSPGTRLV